MSRRNIAVIALALATFAISACSNITGPQGNDGASTGSNNGAAVCQVLNGSSTC